MSQRRPLPGECGSLSRSFPTTQAFLFLFLPRCICKSRRMLLIVKSVDDPVHRECAVNRFQRQSRTGYDKKTSDGEHFLINLISFPMQDSETGYRCVCPQGFEGTRCENKVLTCADTPCFHGGKCKERDHRNSYTCECPAGYTGLNCEKKVDKCTSLQCTNGNTSFCPNEK